jgi:hypothetical protein
MPKKKTNLHTNSLKKLLIMNEKFYNCVKKWHATAHATCVQKWTAMPLFLTLDRFKNHVFYEHKRMKELALFLTDVKKYNYIILQKLKTFYFIKFECIIVVCAFTLLILLTLFIQSGYSNNVMANPHAFRKRIHNISNQNWAIL